MIFSPIAFVPSKTLSPLCAYLIGFQQVQEIYNLQETKKQLEADREKYIEELAELKEGVAPLKEALKEKEQAKAEVVKENR